MHSNFRIGRRPGSEIVLAGFTILFVLITTRVQAGPPQQTQPAGSATTLTATSTNVSDAGRGVKINILRWSTDEERNALVVAMNPRHRHQSPPGRYGWIMETGGASERTRLRLHGDRVAARRQGTR